MADLPPPKRPNVQPTRATKPLLASPTTKARPDSSTVVPQSTTSPPPTSFPPSYATVIFFGRRGLHAGRHFPIRISEHRESSPTAHSPHGLSLSLLLVDRGLPSGPFCRPRREGNENQSALSLTLSPLRETRLCSLLPLTYLLCLLLSWPGPYVHFWPIADSHRWPSSR